MVKKLHASIAERGSLTVEASIIVPVIIIFICILIAGSMLLYQRLLLHYAVSAAAQQGAEIWVDSRKNMKDGSWNNDAEKDSLYYRLVNDNLFSYNSNSFNNPFVEIIDLKSGLEKYTEKAKKILQDSNESIQNKKIAKIRLTLYEYLGRSIIKPDYTELKIGFTNNLLERELQVSLVQKYNSPIRFINSKSKLFEMHTEESSVVSEPAEYIRNMDFCIEKIKSAGDSFNIKSYFNKLKEKIS